MFELTDIFNWLKTTCVKTSHGSQLICKFVSFYVSVRVNSQNNINLGISTYTDTAQT